MFEKLLRKKYQISCLRKRAAEKSAVDVMLFENLANIWAIQC